MSVLINPFDAADFSLAEMTQAIQLVPNQYGRLNSLGMFPAEPLSQRIALVECVGTFGEELYARQIMRPDSTGIDILTESNPLPIVKRPALTMRLHSSSC